MPVKKEATYTPPDNDNLSGAFDALKLVPEKYRGTDKFLDVVTWNLRYFHEKDVQRVRRVAEVMAVINADLFVLEEIRDGSLAPVVETLQKSGAGHYEARYGSTGGDQRVAFMYDLDWLRTKDDVAEVFGKGAVLAPDGKDAFPRLPLRGYFTANNAAATSKPFDFQILGLHLKSQRGGGDKQRETAAKRLATWLGTDAQKVDADVIMAGDWNAPPDAKAWKPLRDLEKQKLARFTSVNDAQEISHLMYQTKTKVGSRLDLTCVSVAAVHQIATKEKKASVIRWTSLDDLLGRGLSAKQLAAGIRQISSNITDHMPVITRFYFKEQH